MLTGKFPDLGQLVIETEEAVKGWAMRFDDETSLGGAPERLPVRQTERPQTLGRLGNVRTRTWFHSGDPALTAL